MDTRALLVTGGGAGIGRAIALRFLREGWTVGAYDIDAEALALLDDEAAGLPGELVTDELDVRDAAQFADRLAGFTQRTGRLDVLVNNAGILLAGRFAELDLAALSREVDVNVRGVLNGLHAGHPHLRRTPGATVVNLASASAIHGQAELANYSATKFYVRGITEALDLEWARDDIRVVDLWPLFVRTGMLDGVRTGTTDSLGVRLTAPDVADAVWDAVHASRARRLLHQVHFPVGRPARVMALGSRFSPAWLTRRINDRLARH